MGDQWDDRFRSTRPGGPGADTIQDVANLVETLHVPAGAPARTYPRAVSHPATRARAYTDGVITTVSRDTLPPDDAEAAHAVPLPYESSDVIRRIGSYDLLAEIGRGGMGVVYRAYSLRLCRPCALKVMIVGEHATELEIVRFQNEAMVAARLQHPHIVSVFDASEEDGVFYFVMELIEGKPLTDLVAEGSDEALRTGLHAIAEAARALHHAHERNIVHRDIKPDNILIDANGHPHITDFGIARTIEASAGVTAGNGLVGTPLYMSPEQANGEQAALGPRSDVYSLGATLYELCTGQPPFTGGSVAEILAQILRDEPPSPRDVARKRLGRDLPLDLETICLKSIEKDASRRYSSALALAEDIEAYLADRPISARPVSVAERLQKLIRRSRAVFVGAAVVFATLLVVGASFGAVMVSTMQRTNASLRSQAEKAAIDQAETLERSIRANMLQVRADVVRNLVQELRVDPLLSYIDVIRTDRTYAYTDLATREQVERRLGESDVVAKIGTENPELLRDIEATAVRTLTKIDAREQPSRGLFEYEPGAWKDIVENVRTVVRSERVDGEPMLTVLKPIENSEKCQACHGEPNEPGYGPNKVRAVLVVKRSQKAVEERIAANRRDTLVVGASTAGIILALVWLFGRLLGVRLRRRRFAV